MLNAFLDRKFLLQLICHCCGGVHSSTSPRKVRAKLLSRTSCRHKTNPDLTCCYDVCTWHISISLRLRVYSDTGTVCACLESYIDVQVMSIPACAGNIRDSRSPTLSGCVSRRCGDALRHCRHCQTTRSLTRRWDVPDKYAANVMHTLIMTSM